MATVYKSFRYKAKTTWTSARRGLLSLFLSKRRREKVHFLVPLDLPKSGHLSEEHQASSRRPALPLNSTIGGKFSRTKWWSGAPRTDILNRGGEMGHGEASEGFEGLASRSAAL